MSSSNSSTRTPVARRTSTIAQAQKAWSSSQFEVASLAGAGVVGPDLAGDGSVAGGGTDQRLPGGGEPLSRLGLAGCLQDRVGCFALLIDAAHQRRQNGQPFAGAGIHAGFAVPLELSPVDLFFFDGAGNRPLGPAPRVVDGPLGQVQVERSDRDQALPIVQPWDVDGDLLPSLAAEIVFCLVRSRCFQAAATSSGRRRLSMPGWWHLQVPPEPRPQRAGEAFHAGVVQRRLAFAQIVHQQVADRTADQAVSVDEFLGCARPSAAPYLPQRGRRVRAEDAQLVRRSR